MRKTAREILNSKDPQETHDWLFEAEAGDIHQFLRLAPVGSHWAAHGRDALNVVVAKESISLQREVRDLTIQLRNMTWLIVVLTAVIGFFTLAQSYVAVKTFYNLPKIPSNNTQPNTTPN